ncbi:PAS domain-containing protein [Neobacillus drentensis]|uniref:PAS domain-containing protein n=1 Tax=Neobacillus drentensis TaxID=220684 RepID=UPI003001CC96
MFKKVEESESNHRLIAEKTLDLLVVLDKEYSIRYFSPSHKYVLGYEESELEGKSFSKLFHPDDVCTIRISLDNMFNNNDSQAIEFRLLHKQGNWIELESHCMPVLGGDNTIEHIVMVSRDISNHNT